MGLNKISFSAAVVCSAVALSTTVGGTSWADMAVMNLSAIRDAADRAAPIEVAGRAPKIAGKGRYDGLIARYALANGVPVGLAHAVIQIESRYDAGARGRSGEVGLMQILPRTARGIGYKGSVKALYNPDTNLRWGMKYLGEAYRRGGKSVCGTIMKYNGGHYAKRHTKWSRAYCTKVKRILGGSDGSA